MSRWAVVLAGGVGSRFWPLSTSSRPKQLLPLVDERPLLVATLDRLAPLVPAERTLILTNASLRDAVREHVPRVPAENVIAEPRAVGTGGALAWAALARVRALDERGNAASGSAVLVDADDNVVYAEGTDVVLYGVRDLVVVVRDGLTLVTTKESAVDLKTLISKLPPDIRDRE